MAGQGAAVGEHLFSVDLEALGDASAVLDVIVQGLTQDASAAEIEVAAATAKLKQCHANVDRALTEVRSVTETETDALTSLAASAEAEVLTRPALFTSINEYAAVYGALLQLESDSIATIMEAGRTEGALISAQRRVDSFQRIDVLRADIAESEQNDAALEIELHAIVREIEKKKGELEQQENAPKYLQDQARIAEMTAAFNVITTRKEEILTERARLAACIKEWKAEIAQLLSELHPSEAKVAQLREGIAAASQDRQAEDSAVAELLSAYHGAIDTKFAAYSAARLAGVEAFTAAISQATLGGGKQSAAALLAAHRAQLAVVEQLREAAAAQQNSAQLTADKMSAFDTAHEAEDGMGVAVAAARTVSLACSIAAQRASTRLVSLETAVVSLQSTISETEAAHATAAQAAADQQGAAEIAAAGEEEALATFTAAEESVLSARSAWWERATAPNSRFMEESKQESWFDFIHDDLAVASANVEALQQKLSEFTAAVDESKSAVSQFFDSNVEASSAATRQAEETWRATLGPQHVAAAGLAIAATAAQAADAKASHAVDTFSLVRQQLQAAQRLQAEISFAYKRTHALSQQYQAEGVFSIDSATDLHAFHVHHSG